jgi:catalase
MTTSSGLAAETIDPAEARVTADFIAFIKAASEKRQPTGPLRRFNQGRAAGCVRAEFTVPDTLPAEHRVGLFAAPRTYDAWIRFANASSKSDRDKDVRGMSIRLSGVEGENLTPGETRQDFVLNSHPVMVAANSKDFMELMKAMEAGGLEEVG